MNVEQLHPRELGSLVAIAEAFTKEAKLPPFNFVSFRQTWTSLMGMEIGHIYVLKSHELVVGVIGFAITSDPFTGRKTALENFWYVVPEHRASGAGLLLLDAFEERAKNCDDIVMVHLIETGEKLSNLYVKRGYKLVEQTFKKSLK
jgi:GNAT superfamily N-acetyltransferase